MHLILSQNGIIISVSRKKLDSFKLKLRQFVYHLKKDVFVSENSAIMIILAFCLILTYSAINSMSRNWTLTERLASEKKDLELLQVEIDALSLENEYYKSAEYQELSARRHADKILPGENMVYLPENSDYAKNKHKAATIVGKTEELSNVDKWLKFLFPKT